MRNILFGLSLCVLVLIVCWFVLDPDGASSGIVLGVLLARRCVRLLDRSERRLTEREPRPADRDVGRLLSHLYCNTTWSGVMFRRPRYLLPSHVRSGIPVALTRFAIVLHHFVGELTFVLVTGLLLCAHPGTDELDDLVNPKLGGVDYVDTPARISTAPAGPTLPAHVIECRAANQVLAPLRIDGVYPLPGGP